MTDDFVTGFITTIGLTLRRSIHRSYCYGAQPHPNPSPCGEGALLTPGFAPHKTLLKKEADERAESL